MADNNDSGVNNADSRGAAVTAPRGPQGEFLPEADVYYVEARDTNGKIASAGRVPRERLQRAQRLFMDEGWTVTVTPETTAPTE